MAIKKIISSKILEWTEEKFDIENDLELLENKILEEEMKEEDNNKNGRDTDGRE